MSFNAWVRENSMLLNIAFTMLVVFCSMEFYRNRKDKLMLVFVVFGLLYPLGWAIKVYHLGPLVLRGYIADVGFVPCFTLWALEMWYRRDKKLGLSRARWATYYGFVIAMNVELVQLFIINPVATSKKVNVPVRGDWIDVMIFMVTTTITFYLLRRLRMRDIPLPEPRIPRAERRRRIKSERKKSRKKR